MTASEPVVPDQPFPGARSQVAGEHGRLADGPQEVVEGASYPADVPRLPPLERSSVAPEAERRRPEDDRPARRQLSLGGIAPVRANGGWSVSLPVRAEQVQLDREVVVTERVVIRRRSRQETWRTKDQVRREELHVEGNAVRDTSSEAPPD